MKKIIYIIITAILGMGIYSCTPQSITEEIRNTQACCGDDGDLPPPPPPPPPYGDNGG